MSCCGVWSFVGGFNHNENNAAFIAVPQEGGEGRDLSPGWDERTGLQLAAGRLDYRLTQGR